MIIWIIWIFFRIVIDTLKNVEPKRKCYRMIGGVLCERTVEDVMPALVTNKEQVQCDYLYIQCVYSYWYQHSSNSLLE